MAVLETTVSEVNSQKIRVYEGNLSGYSEDDILVQTRRWRGELCQSKLGDAAGYLFPEKFIARRYENEESRAVSYVFYLDTKQEDIKVYLKMKWHF